MTKVADYYSTKLGEYGETPQGVDWNSKESQELRFEQLCGIINTENHFSVNDLGCGYGVFREFLCNRYESVSYLGIDVSADMIRAAEGRYPDNDNARFLVSSEPDQIADYSFASGIFNVRLGETDDEWRSYLYATLDVLNRTCRIGFSFNCLTSYSDADKMRDYLYYADPSELFDYCKHRFSRNVALLHDYELYEFTILVRKY